MKTQVCTLLFFYLLSAPLFGQESEMRFKLLRQQDQIKIDSAQNFYERFKAIPIGESAILSFGGSHRFQIEAFVNEEFDENLDQTDHWYLNRSMLHAHLKVNQKWEIFGELNASLINSKAHLIPVDRDELSVNQLFTSYQFHPKWNVLLGRQNMRLGSGRLIDIREGPNVRLAFDLLQLQYDDQNTQIKAFYGIPVRQMPGVFDNETLNQTETLSTFYWTQHWSENTSTDAYIFYKTEESKSWNAGTADDNRVSIGLRHFGNWKGIDYNNEFVFQTGSFGEERILAWTASFNLEKHFQLQHTNLTVGFKTEAISGDRSPDDQRLNTFDGLYPRGAYFGRVARFGPSNLIDIHPYLGLSKHRWSLELDYVAFWRFATNDGIYGPPLILSYPSVNDRRFIGDQFGVIFAYEFNDHLATEVESNLILPGNFLIESDLGDPLLHFVWTTEFKF